MRGNLALTFKFEMLSSIAAEFADDVLFLKFGRVLMIKVMIGIRIKTIDTSWTNYVFKTEIRLRYNKCSF